MIELSFNWYFVPYFLESGSSESYTDESETENYENHYKDFEEIELEVESNEPFDQVLN